MKKFGLYTILTLVTWNIFLVLWMYLTEVRPELFWLKWASLGCSIICMSIQFILFFWLRKQPPDLWVRAVPSAGLSERSGRLPKKKILRIALVVIVIYGGIAGLFFYIIKTNDHPNWIRSSGSYLLTLLFIGVGTLYNWIYARRNKKKIARAMQAQETLNLKLRSIRSQLNPHFMFNALTSVQNLMNKNDIPAANHYLAMFADLTRKVLNTSDQELISVEDELKILEDYLQMERLRFGFKYEISVDDTINIPNTEIPAMLLQPFVENAIKHGVAVLHDKGLVSITINKQANNIVLSVIDNGKGFNLERMRQNKTSLGLKLSEERIALLNQVNKGQPVTFDINTRESGTRVTITLVNLLS